MAIIISGPGVGLPPPQFPYPKWLNNAPYSQAGAETPLPPGGALAIPAGKWMVKVGAYSLLQYLDPQLNIWRSFSNNGRGDMQIVSSDGFTRRVANLTGCPVAAVVTTIGTNYVQGTTTVSVSSGNSTWAAIVGGLVTLTTIATAGAGYGKPPLCFIEPPPSPNSSGVPQGVQATAVAAISSGTVSTVTVTNQGAGYLSAPSIWLLPDPYDPNLGSITNATVTLGLTGSGGVTAVLCTNPGVAIAAIPTLTIAGAGSSAAATPVWMNTILTTTISAAGAGYAADNLVTSSGGRTAATAVNTNPAVELTGYIPRPLQATAASGGTLSTITSISTIYDSGLFTGVPLVVPVGGAVTTVASITVGRGGKADAAVFQQL